MAKRIHMGNRRIKVATRLGSGLGA